MMFHAAASRLVDRSLRPLSDVRSGEGVSSALLMASCFLLLTSYYLLKTAREGMILAGGAFGLRGDELKTYASGIMAVILAAFIPLYGRIANRMNRIALLDLGFGFFIGSLLVFYVLNAAGVGVGLAFYVWLGIASVFLIAQFWSFANDIHTEEQGTRLFPVIAVGGSLGAIVGPKLASIADTFTLLPIAAVLIAVSLLCLNMVEHRDGHQPAKVVAAPLKGPGGFQLLLNDRYLTLIAVMLLVINLVNTTGEYILANAVRSHAMEMTADIEERREIIKQFYGNFYSLVNLFAFVLQAFVVSRLLRRFGVRWALFVVPVLAAGGYFSMAFVGGLMVTRAAKLVENSLDYSLQNTVRQTLFLPVSRVAKYKAKAAVDTFCVRAGDLLAAVLVGVGVHRFAVDRTTFAWINLLLIAIWVVVCTRLAAHHRERSSASAGEL
jgi:ATP:ADP antiporter, AAA family